MTTAAIRPAASRIAALAIGVGIAVSTPMTAKAAGANSMISNAPEVAQPRVMVPHVPTPAPNGGLAGCWSAQRLIYGPYAFSFCSNGSYGSYQVRGGGLACNGSVNVARGPANTFTVQLRRSQCNGWTDWSADRLVCRATGGNRWSSGYSRGSSGDSRHAAEVATPNMPTPRMPAPRMPAPHRNLECTYFPVVSGYHPIGLAMSPN